MSDVTADQGAQLAKPCCGRSLAGKWVKGRIVVCGGCFLPYTAIMATQRDPVSGAVLEVPSWWTALVDLDEAGDA